MHFSTVMAGDSDLIFPDDLLKAFSLTGQPLSFSTIMVGDMNPHMKGGGGAEGSVGMIADITQKTVIDSVYPHDSGSNPLGSLGLPPTEQNCIASIDERLTSNEWRVRDYLPIGIFILPPIYVRKTFNLKGLPTPVETEIDFGEAIFPFPDQRIFSANDRIFLEYDRNKRNWRAVPYEEILARR